MKKAPITQYTLIILGLFIMVTPMVFMITSSLRPNAVAFTWPPRILPQFGEVTFANYQYVISRQNFVLYFRNTLIVATVTTALSSLFASMMAFCISRFRFPGRRLLFSTIISVMLIPGLAMIIPQFELAVWFRLINTLQGVILFYIAWALPFSTFLIKSYMDGLPRELDEATVMDGGNVFTIYSRVILPLASPSIAAVSIFNFLVAFEELAWSQAILLQDSLRTLPVAITQFFQAHNRTDWGYVFALTCLAMIPVVIIYVVLQRYFIAGLSTGAVKG